MHFGGARGSQDRPGYPRGRSCARPAPTPRQRPRPSGPSGKHPPHRGGGKSRLSYPEARSLELDGSRRGPFCRARALLQGVKRARCPCPGLWWATPPPAPTGGYVHKGVLAGGSGAGGEIADFFTFTRIFHARRRRGTPRASDASCVSAVERPRERLPCRPPGRLRAGAPLQPASWPHRLSSLLSKLFPFIRAAAVGRSRPAESSTSLFDWASRAPQALRK